MKLKNKIKKIVALFTMILLVLCGCKQPTTEITPTSLTVASSEVKVIVNSIRDLNDIVTLRFGPKEATQRDVVWSAEENDVFTLEGSTLTAIKLGKAKVTAISVANNQLSTDVTINVYDPNAIAYTVTYEENEEYVISGLQNEYYEGEEVTFAIELINEEKEVIEVKVNDDVLIKDTQSNYNFTMPATNVVIMISVIDKPMIPGTGDVPSDNPSGDEKPNPDSQIKYDIKFDLGTYKTARKLETVEAIEASFTLCEGSTNIIASFGEFEYLYGGGNGGRGETAWYVGDMLKFGTTSVNGYITLSLNVEVVGVKITGYVSDSASKIRVGDASSSDWLGETMDEKTTLVTCSEMAETVKDVVENKQTTTIEVNFASTKNLKIATTNTKPLYITSIEFIIA